MPLVVQGRLEAPLVIIMIGLCIKYTRVCVKNQAQLFKLLANYDVDSLGKCYEHCKIKF